MIYVLGGGIEDETCRLPTAMELHIAAAQRRIETAHMGSLVDALNSIVVDDPQRILVEAASMGDRRGILAALDRGARPDQASMLECCNHPVTPLAAAARFGHVGCVEALIRSGARADLKVGRGYTPLYLAAQNGHVDCVLVLVAACPSSVELSTHEGVTPLLVAAHQGHAACVQVFLLQNAKTHATLSDGRVVSAHEVATAAGEAVCASLLR